eukprot:m.303616 g.303616  ORF g.303616 m.303616 type:complete len:123 (+) comp40836_c0_seq2:2042-2410(+)
MIFSSLDLDRLKKQLFRTMTRTWQRFWNVLASEASNSTQKKTRLRLKEVQFVGHYLTNDGLGADPRKIQAITGMPTPQDVKDLRRVLGMVNYQKSVKCSVYLTGKERIGMQSMRQHGRKSSA